MAKCVLIVSIKNIHIRSMPKIDTKKSFVPRRVSGIETVIKPTIAVVISVKGTSLNSIKKFDTLVFLPSIIDDNRLNVRCNKITLGKKK